MKTCTRCQKEKAESEFNRRGTGYQPRCRACVSELGAARYAADPERFKAYERAKRRGAGVSERRVGIDPVRQARTAKNWQLQQRYGITLEQYEQMLADQNGVCAICHDPPGARSLHVDHDHVTGEVRGLLCHGCNVALGHLQESPTRLEAMLQYVGAR